MKLVRKIDSKDELRAAVDVLYDLLNVKAQADLDLNRSIEDLRRMHGPRYKVTLDGEGTVESSVAYEAQLEVVQEFCEVNRDDLLTGDKKSFDLGSFTLGWTKQKDSINELSLQEEEATKLAEEGLLATCYKKIVKLLEMVTTKLGKSKVASFLRVKLEWDKPALLKAVTAGNVTAENLAEHGLVPCRGIDQFYCKVKVEKG